MSASVRALGDLLDYELCDVFTPTGYAGNQLAVVYASGLDGAQMQRLGQEFNLSETVIVTDQAEGEALHATVRLFTATEEVPFAGHPLLGCAALLARRHGQVRDLVLHAPGGAVPVQVEHLGQGRFSAWMEQPIPQVSTYEREVELLAVLGLEKSRLPVLTYNAGIAHVYVMAESAEQVAALVPDFTRLRQFVGPHRVNVFAADGPGRVVTRMFSAFDQALPEDPACGSAAGPLAAHLVRHGLLESGTQLALSQGEQVGRPSTLFAVVRGRGQEIESIRVGGGVCWVGAGQILCPP